MGFISNPSAPGGGSSGTYAGNDGADRAIPHGLGRVPKLVIISYKGATAANGGYTFTLVNALPQIMCAVGGANSNLAVTSANTTNFYVGNAASTLNSANGSGVDYEWFAI